MLAGNFRLLLIKPGVQYYRAQPSDKVLLAPTEASWLGRSPNSCIKV